jgi:hypothetical protein
MTVLLPYWPSLTEINRCIKTEAESASDAVLLAVHQETPLTIREAFSDENSPATEKDLLEAFLTDDMPEGTLLLSITGASGAGKSHIIRWLSAQLQRDPRAENMHVIRIPKSANLRTVVELILKPLEGNSRFSKARDELQKAVSAIDPKVGAFRFATELQLELKEKAKTLSIEIRKNPRAPDTKEQRAKLDHANRLPSYFNDATLEDHFKGVILPRIVERAVVGQIQNSLQDETLPQFSVDDLMLPDNLSLSDAAKDVRIYYQTILNKSGGKGYRQAVDVLNEVIDGAIRNVFHLNQAMGGITLEDVILEIRSILDDEGKELVLLIEDFAALSGVQEILLNVCIQEAVRDGQQVRAPMRTAIAVTDGYLASRDTILTRAKREWVIQTSIPNEDDVLERTTRMVGAYLNAARWGEVNLEKMLKKGKADPNIGLTEWISVFEDENETPQEAEYRRAFGFVGHNISLFPFNNDAIQSLAKTHLTLGGSLQFNPRGIIYYIIRQTLLQREEFEDGNFPPQNFSTRTPQVDIANSLANSGLSEQDRGRLAQVIVHWGGNPREAQSLSSIQGGLFGAFELPSPKDFGIEGETGEVDAEDRPQPRPEPQPQPAPAPREDPLIGNWKDKLEHWVSDGRLAQQDANFLRRAIVTALNRAIDWNELCMKPRPANNSVIYLPDAMGNPPTDRKLVFAESTEDTDGNLRRSLLAFVRYHHHNEEWDYPEADEDTALIANKIEQLIPNYLEIISEEVAEEIEVLVTALNRQGQLLGIAPRRVSGRQSINDAIFANLPRLDQGQFEPGSSKGNWFDLRKAAFEARSGLQENLKSKISAFQGTGDTTYAVDATKILKWQNENFSALKDLNPDEREHLASLKETRLRARSNALIKELRRFSMQIDKLIGADFDKNATSAAFRELVQTAEAGKVWPSTDPPTRKQPLLIMIDAFRDAPIVDLMNHLSEIDVETKDTELETTLNSLGKIDLSLVEQVEQFLRVMADFLGDLESEISNEEEAVLGIDVDGSAVGIQSELNGLKSIFDELSGS